MASPKTYNSRSSSVKRLLAEAKELASLGDEGIYAAPLEENLHEFHFCIRGPADTEFEGGIYHGRIILPPQYPFKAPDIMLMTPNGRFELNKKVCLTITGFHEESWQPAWGIRTALVGLSSFFSTEAKGAIGGLDTPVSERKRLAIASKEWSCPTCQMKNCDLLPPAQPKLDKGKGKAEDQDQENAVDAPAQSAQTASADAPVSEPIVAQDRPAVSPASSQETVKFLPAFSPPSVSQPLSSFSDTAVPRISPIADRSPPMLPSVSVSSSSPPPPAHPEPSLPAATEPRQRVADLLREQFNLTHGENNGASADVNGQTGQLQAGSPPPVWLDGMIGCVLIALASLLCRKML